MKTNKELIELEVERVGKISIWMPRGEIKRTIGTDIAKQILLGHNLAIIKKCKCGGEGYEDGGDGAPTYHVMCAECCDTGTVVIPLELEEVG